MMNSSVNRHRYRIGAVSASMGTGLALMAGTALAYWSTAGTGAGTAAAGTISTPTVTVMQTSSPGTVVVGFSPGSGGATPTSYLATATYSGGFVSCPASPTSPTCSLTGLTSGTSYSITGVAKRSTWTSLTTSAQLYTPAAVLSVGTTSLPAATINTGYSQTLIATGGVTPYTWSISAGALPAGLALNSSTGVISGTPTTTGTSNFTAQVRDAAGAGQQTTTQALSITVGTTSSPAAFVVTAPSTAVAGTPFNITVQAKNSAGSNDTSYTGVKTLAFSGPSPAPDGTIASFGSANFDSNGLATVSVTLTKAQTVAITVADPSAAARAASSGNVSVSAGTINRLWFTSYSSDCTSGSVTVANKTTSAWTSKVSAADAYGNVVPNTNVARILAVSISGSHAIGNSGSASIPANANPSETTTAISVDTASASGKVGTLTVTGTGLTAATCMITGK